MFLIEGCALNHSLASETGVLRYVLDKPAYRPGGEEYLLYVSSPPLLENPFAVILSLPVLFTWSARVHAAISRRLYVRVEVE